MSNAVIFEDYTPAELHEGKDWQVVFTAWHPGERKRKRKRIRINRYKSITERRKWGNKLKHEINQKLAQGWNPWIDEDSPKAFTALKDAIDCYLRQCDVKEPTMVFRQCVLNTLQTWVKSTGARDDMFVVAFDDRMAGDFLQYILLDRSVANISYNAYLMFLRSMWGWFLQFGYCKINPWKKFKKRRVQGKARCPIPKEEVAMIMKYWREHQQSMHLICQLMMVAGVRRTEATKLKCGDVDLERGVLKMRAEITKNGDSGTPHLVPWLVKLLEDHGVGTANPKHYIFSIDTRDWRPGAKRVIPAGISDRWVAMRKRLQLPASYTLYSLRDSGIQNLFYAGVPVNVVRDQFRHKSLQMTDKYLTNALPGSEKILNELVQEF